MPIDASIYGNLRPVEMPSMLDSTSKAMSLSNLGMQQQRMGQEMAAADRDGAYKAHKQKISVIGNALESMSGMPDEARAKAYPQVRAKLIQDGLVSPEGVPEQYDPGLYRQTLMGWRQTPEYLDQQKTKAEIAHLQAQAAKDRSSAGKDQGFELGSNLRKEWTGLPTTKSTQEVAAAYNKIQNAAADPSAAGDLSLLYGFNKLLDPGSAVKEQEFANAAAAGSVNSRIRGAWEKVISGQRLSPEQRDDFINQSNHLYSAQLDSQKTVDGQYTALAQRYGVDPSVVMMKFPNPKELKLAVKQEESKPGWLASLFGSDVKGANASTTPKIDFSKLSDDELYQQWSASQGKQ